MITIIIKIKLSKLSLDRNQITNIFEKVLTDC